MDKDNINNIHNGNNVICKATTIREKLFDIQNVVQMLEVSLASNNDDKSIIRSVSIINSMIGALIENECKELIQLCSDCGSI